MAAVVDVLHRFVAEVGAIDLEAPGGPEHVIVALEKVVGSVCDAVQPSSCGHQRNFAGVRAAVIDIVADSQESGLGICIKGLSFAAGALADALAGNNPILRAHEDPNICSYRLSEPAAGSKVESSERVVTRLQCLQVLAAGFFGAISRSDWGVGIKRQHESGVGDMPAFAFRKLWEYDCGKWNTKNFVLMSVMIYFYQVSRAEPDALKTERITITRKAIGTPLAASDEALMCPFKLERDAVSIHDFVGDGYLQADFANEYLGGGVLCGGGSQEESLFLECTELLICMYLVEKMLPFEAVEMAGARKYVEHNMMGSRYRSRGEQFCRPVEVSDRATTVTAFDAICFNAYGKVSKGSQYQPPHVLRELRKCSAALCLPQHADASIRRSFVTGNWGSGAFRGDLELKCVIQWICCSMERSADGIIYCPFDQHKHLVNAGLENLIAQLAGKVPAKAVLGFLTEDPDYLRSSSTFEYLLNKVQTLQQTA